MSTDNFKMHKSAWLWSQKLYFQMTPAWEDLLPAHTAATDCSHSGAKSNPTVPNVNHTPTP